jgi:hypothetical protein
MRSYQQADANAYALVQRMYPDGLDDFLPAVEAEALAIVERLTQRVIEEKAVQTPTSLAMLRARQIAKNRNGGSVESGGAILEEGAVAQTPDMIAKMDEAGFKWDDVDGWVEKDAAPPPPTGPASYDGDWFYHGTWKVKDESIRKVGMHPNSGSGNWTKNLEDTEKFAPNVGDPVFRTKRPGGQAISDKVQQGSHVKPDDMQVSYDKGKTWTDVAEVNKFYDDIAELQAARLGMLDELAEPGAYKGDMAGRDAAEIKENIEGWQEAKADAVSGGEPAYAYDGVIVQHRKVATQTLGRKVDSGRHSNAELALLLENNRIIWDEATGAAYWPKYNDYNYAIFEPDGTPAGSFRLGVKDGKELTITDAAAPGGKEVYHAFALRELTINDFGGRVAITREMWTDFIRNVEEQLGADLAMEIRESAAATAVLGKTVVDDAIATNPADYAKLVPTREDVWLKEYSAGGSKDLNTPLRKDEAPTGPYADPSDEALLHLDRATHRGAYPADVPDFITYRGVGEKRYGAFSSDYVDFLMTLKAGDDIIDKAYWSTTSSEKVSKYPYFAGDPNLPVKRVHFTIHNRPGQRAAFMSHVGNESEILAPRNSSYHVIKDPVIEYANPKGAPSGFFEFTLSRDDAERLAEELEHSLRSALNGKGFVPDEVAENVDAVLAVLRAQNDSGVYRLENPAHIEELISTVRTTAGFINREINDPFHYTHPPEWDAAYAQYRKMLDDYDNVYVEDMGTDIHIELENLGDDPFVDPDALQKVVDDTQANGGGTFEARYLAPYDPADVGGLTVATFREGNQTSYKRLTGADATNPQRIREAVEEVRYMFPDDPYVGTWYDDAGTLHIGPTQVFAREAKEEAFALAREKGQMTVYDYDVGTTYPTPNSYKMTRSTAYTRKNGSRRSHTQNARDFKRAIGRTQKEKGTHWERLDDIVDNPDSHLYMDPNGQTGALVAPDGRIEYFWSQSIDSITDAPVPLDEFFREIAEDGIGTHAAIPEYAVPAAVEAGMVPVARVGDDIYMAFEKTMKPEWDGAVPVLSTDAEAVAWLFQNATLDSPKPWSLTRTVGLPWEEGAVKWAIDVEQDVANYVPRLDPSLADVMTEMTPVQRMKIHAMQRQLQQMNPKYVIKKPPKGAVPYYEGQGRILDDIFDARSVLENTWYEGAVAPLGAALSKVFDPVYSRELAEAQRQEILTEFLEKGVNVGDATDFLKALGREWETRTFAPGGLRWTRRPDMMNPNAIRAIAADTLGKEVVASIKAGGDDIVDILRRSGSRTYRSLEKKFPATENGGKGALGGLLDYAYGKGDVWGPIDNAVAGVRYGSWAVRTGYHIWRFLMDPRWIFLNSFEPDILAWGRAGRGPSGIINKFKDRALGTRGAEAKGGNLVVGKHTADHGVANLVDYDDLLLWDSTATGWLDPRNVQGYINDVFDVERKATATQALKAHIRLQDDVYKGMGEVFGENLTGEQWAKALDDKLMGFDTVGVEESVLAAAALDGMHMGQNALLDEFLTTMIVKNRQVYRDVIHTFHGNMNRSNIERLANSPLLWWPLSYQLKAGKWVFDMLTKQVGGAKTDLLGLGYFNFILQKHNEKYEHDTNYRAMFDDNMWTWRALGMMIPMTPMDMGVYMARWTRYSSDWLASQMGISEANPHYPQTLGDFLDRSMGLGPMFTADLLKYIGDEFQE